MGRHVTLNKIYTLSINLSVSVSIHFSLHLSVCKYSHKLLHYLRNRIQSLHSKKKSVTELSQSESTHKLLKSPVPIKQLFFRDVGHSNSPVEMWLKARPKPLVNNVSLYFFQKTLRSSNQQNTYKNKCKKQSFVSCE